MNKQIKKLAEQAGYLPDSFGVGHWDMPECEKFAELIIQECISQVALIAISNYDNEDITWTSDMIIKNIKNNFGLEDNQK